MAFTRRSDATLVRDLPRLRRVIPYLMRTRAEGTVYFPQRIEVEETLSWLDEVNLGRPPDGEIHLFHVFLTAIGRTVRLRPETNRFVAGRRTYQHDDISVTFVVKKQLHDAAEETEARLVLSGDETVDEVRAMVDAVVHREREGERQGDDRLVDFFASWPRPVLNGVARTVRFLDYHNLMPRSLVAAIPLYTSVYVVNTGSIGVDAPYHHLYEHGSASVFVAIGKAEQEPVVDEQGAVVARTCVRLVYTLDERASDGYYFAKSAEVFRQLVSRPTLLARPDITLEEIVPVWPPPR
jgi:hypothetical protein